LPDAWGGRGLFAAFRNRCGTRRDKLTEYRFNTGQAVHFFCSVCGIYTFHQRRSNPQQYGVNVACIDGVSPFDFPCVEVNDGVNHPKDGGGGVVGYLRYEKKKSPPAGAGGVNY
jgi:hypothetical protein